MYGQVGDFDKRDFPALFCSAARNTEERVGTKFYSCHPITMTHIVLL